MSGPLRVLHCPTLIGSHPPELARAERAVGLASHCVGFRPLPYSSGGDEILSGDPVRPVLFELRRWRLLARALLHFDVIHFNFGRSILPSLDSERSAAGLGVSTLARRVYHRYARALELRDVAWLRRAGKIVVATFQGDDVRPAARWTERLRHHGVEDPDVASPSAEAEARRRWRVAVFRRHAHALFALNPDLLADLGPGAHFLPYAHVDLEVWRPGAPPKPHPDGPLVVHAPTQRGAKGTRFLLGAVAALRAEGARFRFALIEGVSREQASLRLREADLVVDQLVLGWYGGIAVEAMALGKPVVCYLHDADLAGVPAALRAQLPILQATPRTVADVLREWTGPRGPELAVRGAAGRAFVERWHASRRIAAALRTVYEELAAGRPAPDPAAAL